MRTVLFTVLSLLGTSVLADSFHWQRRTFIIDPGERESEPFCAKNSWPVTMRDMLVSANNNSRLISLVVQLWGWGPDGIGTQDVRMPVSIPFRNFHVNDSKTVFLGLAADQPLCTRVIRYGSMMERMTGTISFHGVNHSDLPHEDPAEVEASDVPPRPLFE